VADGGNFFPEQCSGLASGGAHGEDDDVPVGPLELCQLTAQTMDLHDVGHVFIHLYPNHAVYHDVAAALPPLYHDVQLRRVFYQQPGEVVHKVAAVPYFCFPGPPGFPGVNG